MPKQAIEALRAAAEGEGGVSFTADARKTGSLCERALEIIEQHYMDEDLSLASLSAMLDVSPNHLSACIKKSEGRPSSTFWCAAAWRLPRPCC